MTLEEYIRIDIENIDATYDTKVKNIMRQIRREVEKAIPKDKVITNNIDPIGNPTETFDNIQGLGWNNFSDELRTNLKKAGLLKE